MSMREIYISGAISGLEEQATRKRFREAQELLNDKGFDVVNPFDIDISNPLCSTFWANAMIHDLIALSSCHNVYMLKGWENSPGARIERDFAVRLGLEVIYE